MSKEICAVRDIVADVYHTPFMIDNTINAVRQFSEVVRGEHGKSQIASYPNEHELRHIGTFDSRTGKIKVCDQILINGKAVSSLPREGVEDEQSEE